MAALLAVVLLGTTPVFAQGASSAKPPALNLPGPVRGEAAIAALGSNLPAVAAYYDMSTSEFARRLRTDSSLWIDRRGRALYIDQDWRIDTDDTGEATEADAADPAATADLLDSAPYPLSQTFALQSKADAPRVIYLDFDGHVTIGTAWNQSNGVDRIESPPYDTDGNTASFSDTELRQIQRMWRQVAEDFAPFDVNVTTQDPGSAAIARNGSGDAFYGTRVVITRDNFANCGCGGFAYLRAFDDLDEYLKPAFVFNTGVKGAGEAITHEVGHNLGLNHDGVVGGAAYYRGHGSGETGWAPVMGVGYYENLVQWSKGEYSGANNAEDDLARMQSYGAPLLPDDHGDSAATASDLVASSDGTTSQLSTRGLIGTSGDRDVFRFFAGSGSFSLSVNPVPDAPNLDILATLRRSDGTLVASANPASALAASLSGTLAAGEYYLEVDGTGKPEVLGEGYSDYGSLGYYSVSGTVADPGGLAPPVAVIEAPGYASGVAPLYVAFDGGSSTGADSWAWDFGDGAAASGAQVNHSYQAPGEYLATLTVTSPEGLTDSAAFTVMVENRLPVARIDVDPQSATAPVTVTFDGGRSSDADTATAPEHRIDSYSWDFGDGATGSGKVTSHEYFEGGSFTATLTVTDSLGDSTSTSVTLEIAPPPFVERVADSDQSVAGSVSGSVVDSWQADGAVQTLREGESGGRKSSRYSVLEHRWYFSLPAGDTATLEVTGWQDASTDGDQMRFSYQLGGGAERDLPLVLDTNPGTQLASLPAGGGALTLILRDSDQQAGNNSLDAAYIDALRIRVSNGGDLMQPPAAPSALTAQSLGSASIALSWLDNASDESGFRVYRSTGGAPAVVATLAADTAQFEDTGLSGSTTYSYEVRAFNAAGESPSSNSESATTDATEGIVLSGSGVKDKGVKTVSLQWEGASNVTVFRDGNAQGTASGSFTETLGKGGGSYQYQVCDSSGVCSNLLTIVF